MGVPDDLRAADHLLQLVDPAVEHAHLFLRLLVLWVVLDVARLERFLQPLARLGAPLQRDLQVALELLQALRGQQYRFGEVHHTSPNLNNSRAYGPLRSQGRSRRTAGE